MSSTAHSSLHTRSLIIFFTPNFGRGLYPRKIMSDAFDIFDLDTPTAPLTPSIPHRISLNRPLREPKPAHDEHAIHYVRYLFNEPQYALDEWVDYEPETAVMRGLFRIPDPSYDERVFSLAVEEQTIEAYDGPEMRMPQYPFADHYDKVTLQSNRRFGYRKWTFFNAHNAFVANQPPYERYNPLWGYSSEFADDDHLTRVEDWCYDSASPDAIVYTPVHEYYAYDVVENRNKPQIFTALGMDDVRDVEMFHQLTRLFEAIDTDTQLKLFMDINMTRITQKPNRALEYVHSTEKIETPFVNNTKQQAIDYVVGEMDYLEEAFSVDQKLAMHMLFIIDNVVQKALDRTRSSSDRRPTFRINRLRISYKEFLTHGAAFSAPKPEYADDFYCPMGNFGCVYDCLRHAGIIRGNSDMRALAEKIPNINFARVGVNKLRKILDVLDTEGRFKVVVYKLTAEGINSGTPYLSAARKNNPSASPVLVRLLSYQNHMMVIKRPTHSDICADMFTPITDTREEMKPIEEIAATYKCIGPTPKVLEQRARNGFNTPDVYIWDTETVDNRTDGFRIYQLSVIPLSAIMVKSKAAPTLMDNDRVIAKHLEALSTSDGKKAYEDTIDRLCAASTEENPPMTDFGMSFYGDRVVERFTAYLDRICAMKHRQYNFRVNVIMNDMGMTDKNKHLVQNYDDVRSYVYRCVMEIDHERVQFWAHNSSRFDSILMLSDTIARKKVTSLLNSGGILTFTYDNIISFRDSHRFPSCSLDAFCKSMRVPKYLSKTTFPYRFVKEATINYVGDVPSVGYWEKDETGVVRIPEKELWATPGTDEFSVKRFTTKYAMMDVISLGISLYRFAYTLYRSSMQMNVSFVNGTRVLETPTDTKHIRGLNMFEYVTLASFADSMMREYLNAGYGDYRPEPFNKRETAHAFRSTRNLRFVTARFDPSDEERFYKNIKTKRTEKNTNQRAAVCFNLAKVDANRPKAKAPELFEGPIEEDDTRHNKDCVYVCQNAHIDSFIRQAIRGGRSVPMKAKYVSPQYADGSAIGPDGSVIYDRLKEFLVVLDATSLYPSVMQSCEFPTGKPEFVSPVDFPAYMARLNAGESLPKHSIIDCEITHTKKDIAFPLLSERVGVRTQYNFNDKRLTLCNVDIEEAVKYNHVRVTRIHRIYEWPAKRRIFEGLIDKLFAMRVDAKKDGDGTMDLVMKLIMNIMYGVTVKELIDTSTEIISDNDNFEHALLTKNVTDYMPFGERIKIEAKLGLDDVKASTPSQIGVFVLAFSKQLINMCVDEFDGFGNRARACYERGEISYEAFHEEMWDRCPYYTDTDSLYVKNKYYEELINGPGGVPKRNPWGLDWVFPYFDRTTFSEHDKAAEAAIEDPLERFNYWPSDKAAKLNGQLTQFHDDANDKLYNPRVYLAHFIAPKCKSIAFAGIDPAGVGKCPMESSPVKYEIKGTFKGVNIKRDRVIGVFDRSESKSATSAMKTRAPTTNITSERGRISKRIMHHDIESRPIGDDLYDQMSAGKAIMIQTTQFERSNRLDYSIHNPTKIKVVNAKAYSGKQKIDNHFISFGYGRQ